MPTASGHTAFRERALNYYKMPESKPQTQTRQ